MKPFSLLLVALLFSGFAAFAQESPDDELRPDEGDVAELEVLGTEFGDGSKGAAPVLSLRRYCPRPGNQAGLPGGARLGLAFSYGAMTILKAKQQNWSPAQVQKEAFSSSFLFEMLPKDAQTCRIGSQYASAIRQLLTQTGNLKAAQYDTRPASCRNHPAESWQQQAARYRIDGLVNVFRRNETDVLKQVSIRQTLRNGRPVVAVLEVDPGFNRLRTDTWQPDPSQMAAIWHPVVVVGYDDTRQAFECLNSMGNDWGNGGFFWLRYDDLRYMAVALSLVDRPDNTPPDPTPVKPTIRPKPVVVLRGGGNLRRAVVTSTEGLHFEPVSVVRKATYYETRNAFPIGEKLQLVSNQLPRFGYVYILSVDAAHKAELHFPESGQSPYVADDDARLVFPRSRINENGTVTERGFDKVQNGADWLITLYSKERLNDEQLNRWINQLQVAESEVVPTLQRLLGNRMVPWQNVTFAPNEFRFTVKGESGSIVPLIVKVNGN
jgi:hypothetical protein